MLFKVNVFVLVDLIAGRNMSLDHVISYYSSNYLCTYLFKFVIFKQDLVFAHLCLFGIYLTAC